MLLKNETQFDVFDRSIDFAELSKSSMSSENRKIDEAQNFCYQVAKEYWISVKKRTRVKWRLRRISLAPDADGELSRRQCELAKELGNTLVDQSPEEVGYVISLLYQRNLPKDYREKFGIYYTPKSVVDRMLDSAEKLGVDFTKAHIVDPSSGGAAYLAPLCRKMLNLSKRHLISDISSRLVGIEIDPFAAWLSQFLVDCVLAEYSPTASCPPRIVKNISAFDIPKCYFGKFDYVIGNPPYGVIKDSSAIDEEYSEVISGKANLYQLFIKLGVDLVKQGGILHYITPTGYLSGSYFRKLRTWIEREATPLRFEFFEDRKSIFQGVQQEIVISVLKKGSYKGKPDCIQLLKKNNGELKIGFQTKAANCQNGLWVLPKSKKENKASRLYLKSKDTIESLGFIVKTGCLVPYRNQERISFKKKSKSFPIIWSEAVYENSVDLQRAYIHEKQKWYKHEMNYGVLFDQAILIKRTSSKEQRKRIYSACISKNFLKKYGGFIAENHVNVVSKVRDSEIKPSQLSKFINSEVFEELFKCCSGTVTVSATEIRQIPMPTLSGMIMFQEIVGSSNSTELINLAAEKAYEV
ncbi:N-6 DNA methylase [Aurantivibrio infirmus]